MQKRITGAQGETTRHECCIQPKAVHEIGGEIMQAPPYTNNFNVAFGKCSLDYYVSFGSQFRGDRARSLTDLDVHLRRG